MKIKINYTNIKKIRKNIFKIDNIKKINSNNDKKYIKYIPILLKN